MPELPEVTTAVHALNRAVRGKVIRDVTTDAPKLIRPLAIAQFRAALRGQMFRHFSRRGKFILAELGNKKQGMRKKSTRSSFPIASSPSLVLLWHLGMTGHPLYRNPKLETRNKKLAAAFADPMNRHVRLTFHFHDGTRLEYADVRKFGKFEILRRGEVDTHPQLRALGPDALAVATSARALCARLKRSARGVKVALMDQTVVAGMGNIYADEVLWAARLHPLVSTATLTAAQCGRLARAMRAVLPSAIHAHGTSIDDYRRLFGTKGTYGDLRRVYQRAGLPCPRCGAPIRRLVVGGRGTHVCPRCQRRPRGGPHFASPRSAGGATRGRRRPASRSVVP